MFSSKNDCCNKFKKRRVFFEVIVTKQKHSVSTFPNARLDLNPYSCYQIVSRMIR